MREQIRSCVYTWYMASHAGISIIFAAGFLVGTSFTLWQTPISTTQTANQDRNERNVEVSRGDAGPFEHSKPADELFSEFRSDSHICQGSSRTFRELAKAADTGATTYVFAGGNRFSCFLNQPKTDEELTKLATEAAQGFLEDAQKTVVLSPDEQNRLWEDLYEGEVKQQREDNFYVDADRIFESVLGKERAQIISANKREDQARRSNYMLPWLISSIAFELALTEQERRNLLEALAPYQFDIPDNTREKALSEWDDDDEIRLRGKVIPADEDSTEEEKKNNERERDQMVDAILRERIASAVRPDKVEHILVMLEGCYAHSLAALGVSNE